MAKNRWIAAVLNFFIGGLGYIYLRKRIGFGVILTIGYVIGYALALVSFVPYFGFVPINTVQFPIVYRYIAEISSFIVPVAFAYDAYQLAKEPPLSDDAPQPHSE